MESSTQRASSRQSQVWKGLGRKQQAGRRAKWTSPLGQKGDPSGCGGSAAGVNHILNKLTK